MIKQRQLLLILPDFLYLNQKCKEKLNDSDIEVRLMVG